MVPFDPKGTVEGIKTVMEGESVPLENRLTLANQELEDASLVHNAYLANARDLHIELERRGLEPSLDKGKAVEREAEGLDQSDDVTPSL